ncbi:ribosome maturation factor RimP [soil metagenome]
MKGTAAFPSSFLENGIIIVETPYENILKFLEKRIDESGSDFLVDLKMNKGNQLVVLIDSDEGVNIAKCAQINKELYKYVEDAGFFPGGNFSIEVSSPGIDEPLKLHRQYNKNVGRDVEVLLEDSSIITGELAGVKENSILLKTKTGKGKKAINSETDISFDRIKRTKVLVKF